MMASLYDPIQLVFDKSIRDFKANLKDDGLYSEILQTTTIDQVYDVTDKLQAEQTKNGHMRHMSKIGPFLERLRLYVGAIEVFVQVKPDMLALIWGPIKLLLQWTSVLKQSLDGLIKTIADVGDLLPEFTEVMKLFGHNEQMKDVLALFFQDILDIYVIALKFFSKSLWRLVFEAVWPKEQERIGIVMSHIERHTLLMRNEVRMEHIREEHKARLEATEHFERTEGAHRRQEYNAIKEAISPTTYDEQFDRICGRICEGTGKWLLRDVKFNKWLTESQTPSTLIWLQGIPGAGKTYLSSTVIDQALKDHRRTLFVLLSYTFRDSLSALSVIHSLIFQLTECDEDLQTILCQSTAKELKRNLNKAVELLTTLLSTAGPVFIVIDGLDEIDEVERGRLLRQLLELSNCCDETKILVSSRMEDDIQAILLNKVVEIRVDNRNAGSIQAFINRRVKSWLTLRDFVPEARAEIEELLAPLASKANGMFLYVKVVLSSIEHLDDLITIRNVLQVLPETLDDAYARILGRIDDLNPPILREKARKLLGWIGCSLTPLTIQELEQALAVRMDDVTIHARVIAKLNPIVICGPILEVVDDYVQFVHFTAREYIFSPHVPYLINLSDATLSLASCCIQYLCQRHHDADLPDVDIRGYLLTGMYRLHEYSATMWYKLLEHYIHSIKSTAPPSDLINLLQMFIEHRSSDEFISDTASPPPQVLSQVVIKSDYPGIYEMLNNAASFQKKSSEGEYDKRKENSWITLEPMSISRVSIRLHDEFNQLLCANGACRVENCHCALILRHYGNRPFKCSFLGCFYSRHGFLHNSARNSHQRHHERPWKCNRSDCPYSKGFLSRKMRDQHWEQCQLEGPKTECLPQDLDEDEIQAFVFDLIRADKVEACRSLASWIAKPDIIVRKAMLKLAAASASGAMIDVLVTTLSADVMDLHLPLAAIEGRNLETFSHIVRLRKGDGYARVLSKARGSKCEEFSLDWELNIEAHREWYGQLPHQPIRAPFEGEYASQFFLKPAKKCLENERFILLVWEKLDLAKTLPTKYLGDALLAVAQTCCSVRLATYVIEAGASVDYRRSSIYHTPLHHATTHNTPEAAQLIKFLLSKGANPTVHAMSTSKRGSKIRRIEDEAGAKGISKWLGMSWDDLVNKALIERGEESK